MLKLFYTTCNSRSKKDLNPGGNIISTHPLEFFFISTHPIENWKNKCFALKYCFFSPNINLSLA